MPFRDRQLIRRLKRCTRRELKQTKGLWRQAKQHRRTRTGEDIAGWLFVLWVQAIAFGLLIKAVNINNFQRPNQVHALFAITLYEFLGVLWINGFFSKGFTSIGELFVWSHYPLADEVLVRYAWQRTWRFSLVWLVVLSLVYYLWNNGQPAPWPPGILLLVALAHWVMVVAISLLVQVHSRRKSLVLATFAFGVMIFVLSIWFDLTFVKTMFISLAAPFGTLNAMVLTKVPIVVLVALNVTGAMSALFVGHRSYCRLLQQFVVPVVERFGSPEEFIATAVERRTENEIQIEDSWDIVSEDSFPTISARKEAEDEFAAHIETQVRTDVRDRHRKSEDFWIGRDIAMRVIGCWLTPRQRTVAEFLMAGEAERMPNARKAVKTTLRSGVILVMVLLAVWGRLFEFVAYGALAIMFVTAVVRTVCQRWPGFFLFPMGVQYIPLYVSLPISYREVSAIVFKTHVIRFIVWGPILFSLVFVAVWLPSRETGLSIFMATTWLLNIVAISPLLTAWRMSPAWLANAWNFWGLFVGFLVAAPFLIVGGFGWVLMWAGGAVEHVPGLLFGALVLFMSTVAYWRRYQSRYNRGRLDLIVSRSVPPTNQTFLEWPTHSALS